MPGDEVEDMHGDAEARRSLVGNNMFENLGEPIKKLLVEVEGTGKEIDDKTMELLQHITVKQLAKIFEMLGQGEDPETILAWLKRRARKNKAGKDDWAEERKAMIQTGAERDPVAFFKAIEEANAERAKEFEEMEQERDQLRLAKTKEREAKRKENAEKLQEAKKAVEDEGGWWKATEHMPEKDKNAVNAAFEKFAAKQSEFDNADKDQDGEWWKRDPYRRDWERNKGKGKKWTGVVEGAKEKATDAELAVREEFYKGNDWWKADKFKRDWDATKEADWWKEEPYIKDWQQNKHEGVRWKAADEESGLEGEGNTYPATGEEQKRREDWYKANGPRGVVKAWNAATEGDPEKCSVPEKKNREEYYRNGDWWKGDDARQEFKDKGLDADALQFAKAPQDSEWWKQEPYREDFFKNGTGPAAKKWNAINEDAGIDGVGDKKPAPEAEKKEREDWYNNNWWKAPQYKDDWQKNGKAGKEWKAPGEKEAKSGDYKKPVGEAERAKREEWYKNGDDEWWKAPQYIEDYHQNGDAGRHWPAKTEADGVGGRGQENEAKPDERKKREEFYRANWWKQPKYTDDFHKNGALGDAWQSKNDNPNVDKDWWKQAPFIENWTNSMKPKTLPPGLEWWKQPQYVEDYQVNGPKGKNWTAKSEANGVAGKGDTDPADAAEKQKRQDWYGDNWWKAPRCAMDWAKNGAHGEEWRAGSPAAAFDPKKGARTEPCTEEQAREREAWYRPEGDMWRAVGEEAGFDKKAAELPCTKAEALKRDEWYRTNWWKAPEYVEDWKKNGAEGTKWPGACEESGKAGKAKEDPCSPEEAQKRDNWYRNAGDNEWWKEPQYCEDWANHGPDGDRWTADNRPNANKNGGKEHPCTPEETADREAWYKDNWWKTPTCYDDWKKNGPDGQQWVRDKPMEMDRQDPETIGDGWWKKPEYIEDWLKNGEDGRNWTADDPVSAAAGQGHKNPASDPEKEEREKWYRDNWWKAPSCADDWAKKGAAGDKWGATDPEATKAEEAQEKPADPEEKDKREDWYRKHGDGDNWWKKPQFIEDFAENGPQGKKWNAGNPTAGALGLADECPASAPEKQKRQDWYKDNWWKAPKHCDDWAKGPAGEGSWKKDATPEEEKERDAWFKKNKGDPAPEEDKDKRDAWFRKHGKEPSGAQLGKREDWYKKQLPEEEKAKRMEWLRDRGDNEKRILADELPEALAAINEGQAPTEAQIKAVKDRIDWNRAAEKDDFDDGNGRKRGVADDEDEPTVGQDEFLRAVADTNLYVAPDEEEKDMAAEEEKQEQEKDEMTRQEEEAAYLAMDAEEEKEKTPEEWQRNYKDPENDDWWKRPKFIDEYQKNPEDDDAAWRRNSENDKKPVDPAEQAEREQWMKDNWWKAPKFSQEWREGDDDDDEGNNDNWKKQSRPDEDDDGMVREDDNTPEATPEEVAERKDWFKNAKNPERNNVDPEAAADEGWKRPAMVEDYQDGGDKWKEGTTPEEEKKREDWLKENWWKAPKNIDNWKQEQLNETPKNEDWKRAVSDPSGPVDEDDGMKRNDKLTPDEKEKRDEWFRKNVEPEAIKHKEDTWETKKREPEPVEPTAEPARPAPAPVEPTPAKEAWVSKRQVPEEEAKPDTWTTKRQPPPPEPKKDGWVSKTKELPPPPPPAQEMPPPPPPEDPFHGEKIREEDFPFNGEKIREEDFEVFDEKEAEFYGEKLREDDFAGEKFDEQIAEFFGEKLKEDDFEGEVFKEEEAEFFGEKIREDNFVEKFDEEIAEFFGEKIRDDDFVPADFMGEKFQNEDDEDEDPEWEEPEEEEAPVDEPMESEEEEDDQEAPVDEDLWDEELDDDEEAEEDEEESEEEGDENEHQEDEDLEVDLEAALEEQEAEWEEDDEDDESEEDEHEADVDEDASDYEEQSDEPEKAPEPWMLPLPEVTNNIYLKSYFPVLKWHPGAKPSAADRRVWVVDHFAKSFYCLDAKGAMKKQHDANKLLQLERNIMDPKRARLMFFDAPKSYEVIFQSTEERERFYETGSSIRPAIRVYAPSLTKPDAAHDGASTTTTIDGVKENAVTQKVPNPFKKTGDLVDRELSGRCKINSSLVQDEPVSVWTGTFNMCGQPPPRDPSSLEGWMPKGKYDLYAVGCQEVSYQKEEGEWHEYVQNYLGKEYLVLATMQLWDITMIVLCRKKCLLKITNVEGSTKATLHKEKCGMKGAAGICLKFHNTSMAFLSCHLAARLERTKMRRINVEEIVNQIQLANKDSDLSSQFHHVFFMGDLNYRIEMEGAEAEPLVQQKNWLELLNQDQLLTEMRESGLLHGFKEAPITFPPTYRYKVGGTDYMRDRGRAPSYTDRILVKSTENSDIKCTSYEAAETVKTSEHFPVSATFQIRCLRPHASCFHRDQEPRPQFNFNSVRFTDQTHLMFRKPLLMMYTPFSESAHKGAVMKTSTMLPEFSGESVPAPIQIVVQMTEYLERNHITMIFRDTAEPREDKMFRGAAVMELKDRVEPYDEDRECDLDVICLGKKVGVVRVSYKVLSLLLSLFENHKKTQNKNTPLNR